MNFELLHIDEHVLVVSKAKGVLTTPAHGEEGLVDELDRLYFGRERLKVVHRLDKETSGVLVFARSEPAARQIAAQFAKHDVEREYHATVSGKVEADAGTIAEDVLGKKAKTHFRVERRGEGTTELSLRLETGRRNQIRLHLAGIGHPILGDERFGGPKWHLPGIALHAGSLGFRHPATGETVRFHSPVGPHATPPTS